MSSTGNIVTTSCGQKSAPYFLDSVAFVYAAAAVFNANCVNKAFGNNKT